MITTNLKAAAIMVMMAIVIEVKCSKCIYLMSACLEIKDELISKLNFYLNAFMALTEQ